MRPLRRRRSVEPADELAEALNGEETAYLYPASRMRRMGSSGT
jgi:hypothetical protein